jgi:putative oxygen-independent coproporphyrinogen III oxidase
MSAPRSAYVHIPFCHRRCFYCDFAVVPLGDRADAAAGPGRASIQAYLALLHGEIGLSPAGPPLATVYVGGGTPSLLTPGQIADLLQRLTQRFGLQDGAEITLEMDPASFDQQHLEAVLDAGVTRVSLGGQSFDDAVLASLGRRHRRADLQAACTWLQRALLQGRLTSWSLDLIRNLPGQTEAQWQQQLELALAAGVPHLSVYDLSVEPGTVFAWRQQRGELELPDDGEAVERIRQTGERLRQAGFCRYEVSNYARPGHASRHNRVYWSGAGWWGFGLGATSAPWGRRLARPRTREAYARWLMTQRQQPDPSLLATAAMPLPLDDLLLVGLRRREGVDLWRLAAASGWDVATCERHLPDLECRWSEAEAQGLIESCGRRWRLRDPEGLALSNQVLVEVVRWWETLPAAVVQSPSPEAPPPEVAAPGSGRG